MKRILLVLVATLVAFPALAADIRIEDAWARASLGQARNGAAYMIVHATGAQPDRLVAATSPVAGKVELHNHIMVGNVAQMRPVDAIEVVPGSPTVLQPGGLHVMLLDLRRRGPNPGRNPPRPPRPRPGPWWAYASELTVSATPCHPGENPL